MNKICLALNSKSDAKILTGWLKARFVLYEISEDGALPDDIDLLIIDGISLDRNMEKVVSLKQISAPVILPVLLLTTRKEIGMSSKSLWAKIDELIFLPVEKKELQARISHLLLTRSLSVRLKEADELKLSQQVTKYRKMFHDNPQPMWIYDLETLSFLEVNDAAVAQYGYSREEFLGMTLKDIRPEEDIPSLMQDVSVTWRIQNDAGVWRHLKKNGELRYVSIRSHEIEHEGRKARHVLVTDMTDEIKSREALRTSESNFRQIFENNVSVMLILDPETGFILDANNAALQYYGYTRDEILQLKVFDINTRGMSLRPEMELAKTAEQIFFEFKHRKKNGEIRDVEVFSSRINLNGKLRLHSLIHDVTEKKQAQERIRLLGSAIEQSPVSVLITNAKGEIEYVNPKFTETSGYTFEEIVGRNPRLLKSGRQPDQFYADLWNTITSGSIWRGELINRRKDGSFYWENLIISPVQFQPGVISHFVAVKEDVTEAKAMYQNVVLAKEQAEEASRIKSSFLNNMSHELRTPLIGILGYAELLKEELEDEAKKEMVVSIENSGKRLFETLKAILEISRIEGGNYPVNLDLVDLSELAGSRFSHYENMAVVKKLAFHKEFPGDKLIVSVDKRLLQHAIDNLIDNAIKFTPHGSITVKLQKNPLPPYDGTLRFEAQLSIDDTGIGIAPELQETIFESFRQGSEGLSRSFEGNGLGLSLVKKFTEKMGGRIEVKSTPGTGSSFRLFFPVVTDESIIRVASSGDNQFVPPAIRRKILVVEDDPMARELMDRMLNKIYRIDLAGNGLDALARVQEVQYDLILLDINLGLGMNGLAALSEIRKVPGYAKVPVIAITAYTMEGFKEHVLSSGCDDYISKPFSYAKLLHIVSDWIEEARRD